MASSRLAQWPNDVIGARRVFLGTLAFCPQAARWQPQTQHHILSGLHTNQRWERAFFFCISQKADLPFRLSSWWERV